MFLPGWAWLKALFIAFFTWLSLKTIGPSFQWRF
jgi:hypothetical protein